MTTVADLIDATSRHLGSIQQGKFNFLTSDITSGATSLTCDLTMNGIAEGTLLGIDEEILYVKSVSGQVATVARGWAGTTAAAHTASDAIEIQPRFPRFSIMEALREEIASWPSSLYRKSTIAVSGSTSTRIYNLTNIPSDFYRIIEVRREPYSGSTTWPIIRDWELDRFADTSSFASGVALMIHEDLAEAVTLRVTYAAPFDVSPFTTTTDVTATVGLSSTMLDIAPLGAAWRLLAPRESKRTFTESQSEPRHSDEVPTGATMRAAAGLKMLRDQRITEESDRLASTVALRW